jgi:selenocysteine-specific translation elongation factor
MVAYQNGEPWWFKFNDEMMLAQQEERTVGEDTWVTNIRDWVRTHAMDREYVASMSFLMEKAIVMEKSKTTKSDQMRFAKALIQAGGRRLQRRADGKKNWFWVFNYEQDQQVVDDDGEDGPF